MRAYKIPAEDGTVNTRMAFYPTLVLSYIFSVGLSTMKALRLPYGFVEISGRSFLQHQPVFTAFVILLPDLHLLISAQPV